MADPARWRCPHRLQDVLLAWEGEQHAVFFDPQSGDTHLIAALGAWLAQTLEAGALTRGELTQRLALELQEELQAELPAEHQDEGQEAAQGETPEGLPPPTDPHEAAADLLDQHLPRLAGIGLLEAVAA